MTISKSLFLFILQLKVGCAPNWSLLFHLQYSKEIKMASKDKANDSKGPAQYQFAIKPEEKPGWEGFKQFLWNSETSEFLGRTASSWCKYLIQFDCENWCVVILFNISKEILTFFCEFAKKFMKWNVCLRVGDPFVHFTLHFCCPLAKKLFHEILTNFQVQNKHSNCIKLKKKWFKKYVSFQNSKALNFNFKPYQIAW